MVYARGFTMNAILEPCIFELESAPNGLEAKFGATLPARPTWVCNQVENWLAGTAVELTFGIIRAYGEFQ